MLVFFVECINLAQGLNANQYISAYNCYGSAKNIESVNANHKLAKKSTS